MTEFFHGPVVAVIGAQWGDEGKGKIVDLIAQDAQIVVRGQGGDNAGHTVVNEFGKFALHLTPSGIFNPGTINILGPGVVLNPISLISEIDSLMRYGVCVEDRLVISPKAHLILPYHQRLDVLEEANRGSKRVGTTGKGIGPAYQEKSARTGLRMESLLDAASFREELADVLSQRRNSLNGSTTQEFYQEYYDQIIPQITERLSPLIQDTEPIIYGHIKKGDLVLLEGAQGTLLDVDHGTYPCVTSSNPTTAGLLNGAGIAPLYLGSTIGVFKAYQTRVGEGGMPTELNNETGNWIREKGQEYGATTGRPRRVGWFDAVAARYALQINGLTDLCITRLDILDGLDEIRICNGYQLDGNVIDYFPASDRLLRRCRPIYQETYRMDGWVRQTTGARTFNSLPIEAQRYCKTIEELVNRDAVKPARLSLIGVGPGRDAIIHC